MLDDGLADEHQDADDERHAPLHDQRDRGDEQEDAVGDGVEDLAEVAALVEAAGDPAVDPVGRAQDREQRRGGEQLVVDQQPHEHRGAQQAHQRDQVRNGDDPAPRTASVGSGGIGQF